MRDKTINAFYKEVKGSIDKFLAEQSVDNEDKWETLLYVQAMIDNKRIDLKKGAK